MLPNKRPSLFQNNDKDSEASPIKTESKVSTVINSFNKENGLKSFFENSAHSGRAKSTIQNLTDLDKSYKMLPIRDIKFNEKNQNFNKNDTAENLEMFALTIPSPKDLRNPIRVNHRADGSYVLVSGERRLKAFIYHRNQLLKKYPALKSTEWDFIKAYVHEGLDEYEEVYELNAENVQSRELTPEQRYLAFEAMVSALESKSKTNLTKDERAEIMSRLGVSQRTMQDYLRLRKAAGDFDLFLLKSGRINFTEFKKRTEATIKANRETESRIAAVSIERIVEKHYYDEHTNSVYFVDKVQENHENRDMFCVHSINEHSQFPVYRPTLGNYPNKNEAQYALDIFASDNLLPVYIGDFSEYRKKDNKSDESVSSSPVINESQSNEDTPVDESYSEKFTDEVLADDSSESIDSSFEAKNDNDYSGITNGAESVKDQSTSDEKNENVDYDDESAVVDSNVPSEDLIPNTNLHTTNSEKECLDHISHFEGFNLMGHRVQGSLFVPVSTTENDKVKSDRVYIISGVEFGKSLGNGKFEGRCLLEEVQKGSVVRIDD